VWAVAAAGDVVAAADLLYGPRLFSGASGQELVQLGGLASSMTKADVATIGHYAYLLGRPRLRVVDFADPAAPELVSTPEVCADVIAVVGDRAVVAGGARLEVLDVSEPSKPASVGWCWLDPPPGNPTAPGTAVITTYGVAANSTHAYVSVDVVTYPAPGDFAFTAVVDISDSANPVQVFSTEEVVGHAALFGKHLYVAWGELEILDVTDPETPLNVGTLEPPGLNHFTGPLQVVGSQLFVSDYGGGISGLGRAGVFVLDLADPLHPMIVGEYRTGWDASDVAVGNGRAYIADGLAGVHAVEIGACQTLFVDNLESGGTVRWSLTVR
jgi:hypothetical protein